MCQASGTAGWEPPASLSPSRAALPSAALSSVSDLKPDDLLSAYYVPGLSWPPSFQPLWALLLCAHTLPGLSPISGHFCLPLSPLARLTGSSRRGQGPLGLQSPVSAYTGACRQGGGGGGGGLPVYENPKDPQGGASSLDLKSLPAGAPEQPAQTQALPSPPCWGGPEGRSTESSE